MIEVIYKDEEKAAKGEHTISPVKLPKNVTQIGQGDGNGRLKIYIENQVLKNIKEKSEDGVVYGVLIGKKENDDVEYIFVKNNIEVRNNQENIIIFNDDIWLYIYDDIKKKGIEGDIVGWYVNFPEGREKNLGQLKKLHLDNFAGINKLMFCYEEENAEEGVYVYNNNYLEKQSVYYVYWGKGSGAKSVVTTNQEIKAAKEEKSIKNNSEQEKNSKQNYDRTTETIKRVPWGSVAVIAVLIGVLAFMGNSGMLNSLTERAQNLIENSGGNSPVVDDVGAENKTTEPKDNVLNNTTEPSTTKKDEEADVTNKEEDTTKDAEDTTKKEENETASNIEETTSKKEEETTKNSEEETTEDAEASGNVSGVEYVVKMGETLYDICREHYGSLEMIEKIISANKLENPDKILAGQKLILPEE